MGAFREMAKWSQTLTTHKGPRLEYLHPHGGSQSFVSPVLGDPTPSSDLNGHQACTQTHTQQDTTHKIVIKCFFLKKRSATVSECLMCF